MPLQIDILTPFPRMLDSVLGESMLKRAQAAGLVEIRCVNLRDFATGVHLNTDDRPYGGGPGMVMKVQPLRDALARARQAAGTPGKTIYLSPQGRRLDQAGARELARAPHLILVAGRYEGVDERFIESQIDEEWSIGDYVLSGGELAAMVLIDALTRLLPGALGTAESAQQDSFMDGLLDYPHYTRPDVLDGRVVPKVLLSGDHGAIARWRLRESLGRTWLRRPDLLARVRLDDEQRALLEDFIREYEQKGSESIRNR